MERCERESDGKDKWVVVESTAREEFALKQVLLQYAKGRCGRTMAHPGRRNILYQQA